MEVELPGCRIKKRQDSTQLKKKGETQSPKWRVTTFCPAVLVLASTGLAKRPFFCICTHVQVQSPPLLNCLQPAHSQRVFISCWGFAQTPLCLPSKWINRIEVFSCLGKKHFLRCLSPYVSTASLVSPFASYRLKKEIMILQYWPVTAEMEVRLAPSFTATRGDKYTEGQCWRWMGTTQGAGSNSLFLNLMLLLVFPLQDAFQAFHINPTLVQKFLKPLLIGELAPGEPSHDRDKNVSISFWVGAYDGYIQSLFPSRGDLQATGRL